MARHSGRSRLGPGTLKLIASTASVSILWSLTDRASSSGVSFGMWYSFTSSGGLGDWPEGERRAVSTEWPPVKAQDEVPDNQHEQHGLLCCPGLVLGKSHYYLFVRPCSFSFSSRIESEGSHRRKYVVFSCFARTYIDCARGQCTHHQ